MKKLLSIVLILVLSLSFSVTAFAADITITEKSPSQEYGSPITYQVTPVYTVTIPMFVNIDSEGSGTATISAEGVKVEYGKAVVVTLSGNNTDDSEFTVSLNDHSDVKLNYKVTASGNVLSSDSGNNDSNVTDSEISKGSTVLTVESGLNNEVTKDEETGGTIPANTGASTGSTELTFTLDDTVVYAGIYTGTVTFTVSVE